MGKKSHRRGSVRAKQKQSNNNPPSRTVTNTTPNDIPAPGFEGFDFQFPLETIGSNSDIKERNMIALKRHCEAIKLPEMQPEEHFMMHGVDWFPLMSPRHHTGTTQQLTCLGVPPTIEYIPGFQNLINLQENSQYAALPRPLRAPGKCPIRLEDDAEAQEVVEKFWNGDFSVTLYNPHEKDTSPTPFTIEVSKDTEWFCLQAAATYTNRKTGKEEICLYRVKSREFNLDGVPRFTFKVGTSDPLRDHLVQFVQLQEEEQEEHNFRFLEYRIMHQFLRQYAWMLPNRTLNGWIERTKIPFKGKKKYVSAFLDITMIYADINMNRPSNLTIGAKGAIMSLVAQALETMPKKGGTTTGVEPSESHHHFREVGKLNLEIVQRYFGGDHTASTEMYSRVAANARQISDYGLAIHYLAKCLHSWAQHMGIGNKWNFDDRWTNKYLCDLCVILQEADHVLAQERVGKGTYLETPDEALFRGFASLLVCAQFQPRSYAMIRGLPPFHCAKAFLKPIYGSSPNQAKQALVKIFAASATGQDMKNAIVETMLMVAMPRNPPEYQPLDHNRRNSESLRAARGFLKGEVCGNCRKREGGVELEVGHKHLVCGGCRLVYYCSKACQSADWKKGHKDLCRSFVATKDQVRAESMFLFEKETK